VVIDETEAMIAIDVNTGRHKGSHNQEDSILEVNTEAVEEVARQLRLRNIGGLVVIDLIDMKQKKNRNAVYKSLKDALRRDKARTNVLQISQLGLLEMTRQRVEEGVRSAMYINCPYCGGHGSVKSPLSMSVEVQRQISAVMRRRGDSRKGALKLQIIVHPTVLERLRTEDEAILVNLQEKFAGDLSFRADSNRHVEEFAIRNAETGELLYGKMETPAVEQRAPG
jgi:ribonuclease G